MEYRDGTLYNVTIPPNDGTNGGHNLGSSKGLIDAVMEVQHNRGDNEIGGFFRYRFFYSVEDYQDPKIAPFWMCELVLSTTEFRAIPEYADMKRPIEDSSVSIGASRYSWMSNALVTSEGG